MIGQTVSQYRIVEKIGAGGMGEVYRAHDKTLDRDVALKVLPAASLGDDTARARLLREARSAAALNHPNICTIHEVGEAGGQAYIAMEYIEGEPLSELIGGNGLPGETALRYGTQIADALAHAHQRNVVHRDLKSANVVITPEGRAKVLDFGLAKRLAGKELVEVTTQSQASLTQAGAVLGTLAYMAPEQLRGQPADARSDVWALGVMLYEMLAGQRPFQGQTGYELSSGILNQRPAPLPSRIPLELRTVIERCLEKEPGQRYQRAGEVRAALEAIQAGTAVVSVKDRWRALSRRRGLALAVGLVMLLAVLVGLNLGDLRARLLGGVSAPQIQSLAVLPLENLSGDPEQDYFVEGMHEALITELSKIRVLTLISHTSTRQYRNTDKSVPTIARELGVDAVVEGSVLRAGNTVRITAQLIEAVTDRYLWADNYDRELRDILALHSDVARAIAREIRVTLTPKEETLLTAARPLNPAAYQLYLRGRYEAQKGSREGLEKGIDYFEQALAKDPNSALAYAGLAEAYMGLSSVYLPPREVMPKGKAAALQALALEPSLAEARTTLAYIKQSYEWDLLGAMKELERALEFKPNSAVAHALYGGLLTAMERHEEAIQEVNRALQLDPLSLMVGTHALAAYYFARRYDEAIEQCGKVIERVPTFPWPHAFQAIAYAQKGEFPKAIAAAETATQLVDSLFMQTILAQTYAVSGKTREARKVLEELKEKAKGQYVCPYEVALAHVELGEIDEAFQWFEKAYEARADCMMWMKVDPRLDPIRDDPRFHDLLRRVNLPGEKKVGFLKLGEGGSWRN